MEKEVISIQQAVFLVIIMILGTSLLITGDGTSNQDIWLSILIAILGILPMVFIYGKISSLFPGKNLFEILEIGFGKILGKFISILYICYFIYLGSLSMRGIIEFLQVVSMPATPQVFSALWIMALAVYMVYSGIEILGRWTKLVMIFIFCLIFITYISAIPKFDYDNIRPILYKGWRPVFSSAFTLLTFPFGGIVVFLSIFHTLHNHKKASYVLFLGLIIGGLLLLLTSLRNIFLLGFPNLTYTYFASYYANSIISIGGFVQGIELITSIILVLAGFAKVCVCLFGSCIGLKELFNSINYANFSIPISIIIIILSLNMYQSTMEVLEGIRIYRYIALPFQIFLPPIILLFSWKKAKTQKGL